MKSTLAKTVRCALVGFSSILAAGAANATDSNFCGTDFMNLRATIFEGEFVNAVDQTNLLGKTESAVVKSNNLKITDALKNLSEIQNKVIALTNAPKPKLDQAAANLIYSEAAKTATCVRAVPSLIQ